MLIPPSLTPAQRAIVKSYGYWTSFCHSFGIRPTDPTAREEGKAILKELVQDGREENVKAARKATSSPLSDAEILVAADYGGWSSFLHLHGLSLDQPKDVLHGTKLLKELAATCPSDTEQPTLAQQAAAIARAAASGEGASLFAPFFDRADGSRDLIRGDWRATEEMQSGAVANLGRKKAEKVRREGKNFRRFAFTNWPEGSHKVEETGEEKNTAKSGVLRSRNETTVAALPFLEKRFPLFSSSLKHASSS
ncbi:hypothetical protein JCM8547_003923 [Rhodosporidiobolus lusitaniae]